MEEYQEKDYWALDYGRGYSEPDYEEDDSKPFSFWFEYKFLIIPLKEFRDSLGYYTFFANCNDEFFDLDSEQIAAFGKVFKSSMPIISLYFEVAVNNSTPNFFYSKNNLEGVLEFDLNSSERQNVLAQLRRFTQIYLIKDNNTGLIKIGRSNNAQQRLKTLIKQDTLMPYENNFSLLFWWEDLPTKEQTLHQTFITHRVRGEWFNLGDPDIQFIREKYTIGQIYE
jgi:hypothetical protein